MPRTWQYSRWRRLALQGAMCLLLGASVAVAAYVGAKRRPPQVTLGPAEPHGRLTYALPDGWERSSEKGPPATQLAAETREDGRTLRVSVYPPAKGPSTPGLQAMRMLRQLPSEPIDILGRQGILVEATIRGGDAADDGEGKPHPAIATSGLYAAVILQDGAGVVVSLQGTDALGPSNRKLIKAVLASMQFSPGAEATLATQASGD